MNKPEVNTPSNIPLVIDLDGTLTPSDSLWESLWWLIRHKPIKLLKIVKSLPQYIKNKSLFKEKIVEQLDPTKLVNMLPWNNSMVRYCEEESKRGREIILATASDVKIAEAVKKKFPFITKAIGSSKGINLKGIEKANILIKEFGDQGFDYAGDHSVDIEVWKKARKAILVKSLLRPRLQQSLKRVRPISTTFPLKTSKIKLVAKALRIKQWSKNLLVFAPMIASHAYFFPEKWLLGLFTFLAFSLCASGAYMLNDLLDIEHDRAHHKKSSRPIAEGYFPIPLALILSLILPLLGLIIAIEINIAPYILFYLVSTFAYSVWLKQIAIVDIASLAGLYCLRIVTGGVATSEPVSFWMAAFGAFLFVSLACIKRQAELLNMKSEEKENDSPKYLKVAKGRDYNIDDLNLTRNIGVSTGCIAPLVLALYLEGNSGQQFYAHPEFLWGACGLIFVWIMSLWRDTEQLKLKEEDPISYSISNKKSITLLVLLVITLTLATYIP